MNEAKVQEIAAFAAAQAKEVVRAQIAKGSSKQGMPKARHVATVADVAMAALMKFTAPDGEDTIKWDRLVLRAVLSGSLLNASQLRQDLEKADVLAKESKALDDQYNV